MLVLVLLAWTLKSSSMWTAANRDSGRKACVPGNWDRDRRHGVVSVVAVPADDCVGELGFPGAEREEEKKTSEKRRNRRSLDSRKSTASRQLASLKSARPVVQDRKVQHREAAEGREDAARAGEDSPAEQPKRKERELLKAPAWSSYCKFEREILLQKLCSFVTNIPTRHSQSIAIHRHAICLLSTAIS